MYLHNCTYGSQLMLCLCSRRRRRKMTLFMKPFQQYEEATTRWCTLLFQIPYQGHLQLLQQLHNKTGSFQHKPCLCLQPDCQSVSPHRIMLLEHRFFVLLSFVWHLFVTKRLTLVAISSCFFLLMTIAEPTLWLYFSERGRVEQWIEGDSGII